MTILVSGSVAFDHIMTFPQKFSDHILPEKLGDLNVAFNITDWQTHFGGTGGNIGFCLRLLGEDPLVLATVGTDFGPYGDWFDRHSMSREGLRVIDDVRSPQGFVTTDNSGNQIWNFYEGAMSRAHEARVEDVKSSLDFAIVSANGKQAMLDHARVLKSRNIPTFIDPSHGLPLLDREETLGLIDGCAAYVVNDYEWSLTLEKTSLSAQQIIERCDAVVITKGKDGSSIHEGGRVIEIPPVSATRVADPTGCGDAYRAGLIHGRALGLPFETAGRMGSLLGTWQVEFEGTQNLDLTMDAFKERYEREFGSEF
jgi:adenosine kinase